MNRFVKTECIEVTFATFCWFTTEQWLILCVHATDYRRRARIGVRYLPPKISW
jgi:hypothetical protein